MRKLELLAPAKNIDIGITAINMGADAIYIGAEGFSARKMAANSIGDIANLVDYAHQYHARVYVAFNTILFDHELEQAQKLIHNLYQTGIDALIIQDMGILEMDLPPIALHASTQMHNNTIEKIQFLESVGFTQIVLPREFSIDQITNIRSNTNIALEFFVHGALCVCYSGQCYMSESINKRSANRGECGQPCRLPYELIDSSGQIINQKNHLLSLKDLNLTQSIEALANSGIDSFKIEGRLKDEAYVKNITAHYRKILDNLMNGSSEFKKSSSGHSIHFFEPNPSKTFNRGYTNYFVNGRNSSLWAPDSPKSLGEKIGHVTQVKDNYFEIEKNAPKLNNGDGICFLSKNKELLGLRINRVENNHVFPTSCKDIYTGASIFRNHDKAFNDLLAENKSSRLIDIKLTFTQLELSQFELRIIDEDNIETKIIKELSAQPARNENNYLDNINTSLSKVGGTPFSLNSIDLSIADPIFIPIKELNEMRRQALAFHMENRIERFPKTVANLNKKQISYPVSSIDYKGNVSNKLAQQFYKNHGVDTIEPAFEVQNNPNQKTLMTTKHCLLHVNGKCLRASSDQNLKFPLILKNDKDTYELKFNCTECEMEIKKC